MENTQLLSYTGVVSRGWAELDLFVQQQLPMTVAKDVLQATKYGLHVNTQWLLAMQSHRSKKVAETRQEQGDRVTESGISIVKPEQESTRDNKRGIISTQRTSQ